MKKVKTYEVVITDHVIIEVKLHETIEGMFEKQPLKLGLLELDDGDRRCFLIETEHKFTAIYIWQCSWIAF